MRKGRAGAGEDTTDLSSKGAKAKGAKAEAAAQKSAANARAKADAEDQSWEEGSNVRAAKKKELALKEAEEKERRRKETQEQLDREAAEAGKLRGAEKAAAKKSVGVQRDADALHRAAIPTLHARTIEEAIAVLDIATGGPAAGSGAGDEEAGGGHAADVAAAAAMAAGLASPGLKQLKVDDRNPEKRMKAAFKAYEEREVPKLKAEYPTLRRSQLNEMLFRNWGKSKENPLNMPRPPSAS